MIQEEKSKEKTTSVDMTHGSISRLLMFFCVPLILGNMFQVFYNTVDTMVVGNFVGTEALAAVAAAGQVANIAVFTFNGLSIGAGVVIGQFFGAHNQEKLHRSIETTMAMTFIFSAVFTLLGVLLAPTILILISTPDDVLEPAVTYMRIYFAGVTGLLVYNMGSGILRAVGDSRRPLYFLIVSTCTNVVLDLVFVIVFGMGIAGVAYATIIAQFLSAVLVMLLLIRTDDVYRFSFTELCLDPVIFGNILNVGLPAAFQSMITSLSNSFVIAYINGFGAVVTAGWGCYNKLDQVLMLFTQSMGHSVSAFVSQNVGAGESKRANRGTVTGIALISGIIAVCSVTLILIAPAAISIFSSDPAVIESGVTFVRLNSIFFLSNGINHTLAGSMRGRGDSKAPMVFMLLSFVFIRQTYLYILTRFVKNYALVGFGYPVGWMCCCIMSVIYYWRKYHRRAD